MATNTYISIIILNLNGLNAAIQKHRVSDWIKKKKSTICCLEEAHFRAKDTHRLKVRAWKHIFNANKNDKKAGIAILLSDSSVQFGHSLVSDSLPPHESQHARPHCPSQTPGVHPDSSTSSQ